MIHSDQGAEFQSTLMKEICRLLEIKQTRTSPYHPQSDGLVVRLNRTLLDMLSKICADNPSTWDHHLPNVMCAYRATQHSSTGCSPNLLMLGREIVLPVDLVFGIRQNETISDCAVQYVEWLKEAMTENFEHVRRRLKHSASMQKKQYDKRAQLRTFHVGDWVLHLYPPHITKNKLSYHYTGPYLVIQRIGEVNYLIQKSKTASPLTVHVNDLKHYTGENTPEKWVDCETRDIEGNTGTLPGEEQSLIALENDDDNDQTNDIVTDLDNRSPVTNEVTYERRSHRLKKSPKWFGWDL